MIDSKVKKLSASAPRPVANYKEDITAAEIKISLSQAGHKRKKKHIYKDSLARGQQLGERGEWITYLTTGKSLPIRNSRICHWNIYVYIKIQMSPRQWIPVLLAAVDRCKIRFSRWQVEVSGACACTTSGRRGHREQARRSLYTGDLNKSAIHHSLRYRWENVNCVRCACFSVGTERWRRTAGCCRNWSLTRKSVHN